VPEDNSFICNAQPGEIKVKPFGQSARKQSTTCEKVEKISCLHRSIFFLPKAANFKRSDHTCFWVTYPHFHKPFYDCCLFSISLNLNNKTADRCIYKSSLLHFAQACENVVVPEITFEQLSR
tara:strand:- start:287 stop:652 length:366 start_codon:yes stop_codon:yes gene_type:complete